MNPSGGQVQDAVYNNGTLKLSEQVNELILR